MDGALTVKKANDMARQNEAIKTEQTFLRSNLATGGSSNVDVVQGQWQGARKPNKHSQRKMKTWSKVQNSQHVAPRKCDCCGKSPDHLKAMCPARDASCFKCKKVGYFSKMCRSAQTVDTVIKNAHSDVAFLGEMDQGDHPWLAKVHLEAVETGTLTEIKFKLDTGTGVTVISEEDYKNVGRPKLCESTKTLLGANQTVLKPSGKCCGRLSRGDAMLEEDIYVLGS